MSSSSGKIQTVLGCIDPGDLGATLSHEHVIWDASFLFEEPDEKAIAYEPVRIENPEWLKRNSLGSVENLRLLDEDVAIEELRRFKNAGGSAVLDMGNKGLYRDPEGLARVSRATGVHIVMGAARAVAGAQRITGVPVNIHPGRSQSLPLKIIEMFREFGGDVGHTAMSHLSNRHGLDVDLTIELAETGCYIEYDSFGNFMNPIVLPEKTFYALSD